MCMWMPVASWVAAYCALSGERECTVDGTLIWTASKEIGYSHSGLPSKNRRGRCYFVTSASAESSLPEVLFASFRVAFYLTAAMETRRPFYQLIDGIPRCANVDPVLVRKALNFKAGKGDLVQWSYPKSGTHWVQYLIQLILKGGDTIDSYEEFARYTRPMEYVDIEGWKSTLPIRCFATHLPPRPETMNNEARYVYVARNPWDVCVSLFHMATNLSIYKFEDGTFDEFFETFLNGDFGYGSYFDHVASGYALRDTPNVFFLTYEALKTDTRATVIKLARFLGRCYSARLEESENGLLDQILDRSSPGYMKSVIVMNLAGGETNEWDAMMTRNSMRCRNGYGGDSTKYGIVRNGKVGDWKNYFKPGQLRRLESKIQAQGEKASFMHLWDDVRRETLEASRL